MRDVFISYASPDREAAERVCEMLERDGIGCWSAHRNLRLGESIEDETRAAIGRARVFVLILSARTSASEAVLYEVRAARERDVPIVPVRIEDTWPRGELERLIDGIEFFSAFRLPLERQRHELVDRVNSLRDGDRHAELRREPVARPPHATVPMPPASRVNRLGLARALLIGVGLFAVFLLVGTYVSLQMGSLSNRPVDFPVITPPEENVIYLGNDLPDTPMIAGGYEDCGRQCIQRTGCVAFSFVPAIGACYLKSAAGDKATQAGALSGQVLTVRPSVR